MLSFISFWRAAAIVLNDLGSSAFYAGAIAEQAIGKAAPWFILAIMLFAYAVRSMYIESCSMFVRGGVYRVVKEAMGSTLAKFSVSALMFDYILTGPISGVSAGQYLTGFLNELFARFACQSDSSHQFHLGGLCDRRHDLFLVGEYQGNSGVQRESAADHVRDHGDGGRHDCLVHPDRLGAGRASAAFADARQSDVCAGGPGLAAPQQLAAYDRADRNPDRARAFRSGHERRGNAGPGLPGSRASQAAQPGKGGARHFRLQPDFHGGRFIFRLHDHSGCGSAAVFRESDQRPGAEFCRPIQPEAGVSRGLWCSSAS